MAWTLNGIRIFVQESREEGGQIIPRLQPLDGPTVLQLFGYESTIRTLGAVVVGNTDKDALLALRTTGTAYTLMSPWGSLGNFYVKSVSAEGVICICQTLRTDLAEDSPVYNVEIQLFE